MKKYQSVNSEDILEQRSIQMGSTECSINGSDEQKDQEMEEAFLQVP